MRGVSFLNGRSTSRIKKFKSLNEESREQTLFLLPKNHLYNQMTETYFRVGNTPFKHPITVLMV